MGHQGSASGSLLLDLDGLGVVSAELVGGEWQLVVQTTVMVIGCPGCGVPATPHGRRAVRVRDLPIGGRPVVLCWRKRIWRCREEACGVRTWTERLAAIRPRAVLTRAGPGRGVPAGRYRRPRGHRGRPRPRRRLGDHHAGGG